MTPKRPGYTTKIYTTKPVLDGEPVIWVHHDVDGDWQFFGHTELSAEDGRTVHLGHLLDRDESLRQLLDMPTRHAANRNGEVWDIAEFVPDDRGS